MRGALARLLRRCTTSNSIEGRLVQTVTVELVEDDISQQIERHQNYGLASHPEDGCAGLMVHVAGQRFVIALDDPKYRPKDMQPGEVKVWHKNGDFVHLKNGNEVVVKTNHFIVNSPDTTINGDVQVNGGINTTGGDVVSDGVSLQEHIHTGDDGGHTSPPL